MLRFPRWSLRSCCCVALALGVTSCSSDTPRALLTEVTSEWGLPASPSWPDGRYQIPEITSSGVGVLDADGDQDLDIYLVCHPPPDQPRAPAPNRLFRQEAPGKFVEVPGAAGLADPGHGNAVAVGDVDNDSDLDVYVGNLGADALYVGRGDGTYEDRTAAWGLVEKDWTSAAGFLDHDRDGDLDLYVVHYVVDDPTKSCRVGLAEKQDYCGPSRFQSVPDQLFRNDSGQFRDVSREAGIVLARAGLGVVCADVSGDGWVDIYVANDKQANQLYVNRHNGTFVDEALERGVALSGLGEPEASMGVALGDVNHDGAFDLLVTHIFDETSTLYLSTPRGVHEDRSTAMGIGAATLRSTSWGCGFVDLDHDGALDLPIINGKIERSTRDPRAQLSPFWNDYALCNQLFLGTPTGKFEEVTQRTGGFGLEPDVGRALALGDLDGDGDVDLVTSTIGDRLRVWRNDAPARGAHWLRVRALTGGRAALGAIIRLEAGGRKQVRCVVSTYSYAAASEFDCHFGLGVLTRVDVLDVDWPSGRRERFGVPGVDTLLRVSEGTGASLPTP